MWTEQGSRSGVRRIRSGLFGRCQAHRRQEGAHQELDQTHPHRPPSTFPLQPPNGAQAGCHQGSGFSQPPLRVLDVGEEVERFFPLRRHLSARLCPKQCNTENQKHLAFYGRSKRTGPEVSSAAPTVSKGPEHSLGQLDLWTWADALSPAQCLCCINLLNNDIQQHRRHLKSVEGFWRPAEPSGPMTHLHRNRKKIFFYLFIFLNRILLEQPEKCFKSCVQIIVDSSYQNWCSAQTSSSRNDSKRIWWFEESRSKPWNKSRFGHDVQTSALFVQDSLDGQSRHHTTVVDGIKEAGMEEVVW